MKSNLRSNANATTMSTSNLPNIGVREKEPYVLKKRSNLDQGKRYASQLHLDSKSASKESLEISLRANGRARDANVKIKSNLMLKKNQQIPSLQNANLGSRNLINQSLDDIDDVK